MFCLEESYAISSIIWWHTWDCLTSHQCAIARAVETELKISGSGSRHLKFLVPVTKWFGPLKTEKRSITHLPVKLGLWNWNPNFSSGSNIVMFLASAWITQNCLGSSSTALAIAHWWSTALQGNAVHQRRHYLHCLTKFQIKCNNTHTMQPFCKLIPRKKSFQGIR